MGFQSSLNQTLGAVAGAAFAIKGEAEKEEKAKEIKTNEEAKAKEALEDKQISLSKEESALKVEGAKMDLTEAQQKNELKEAKADIKDVKGKLGLTNDDKEKEALGKDLKARQTALKELKLKIAAQTTMRADWQNRLNIHNKMVEQIGGLK